jgi:transposase
MTLSVIQMLEYNIRKVQQSPSQKCSRCGLTEDLKK